MSTPTAASGRYLLGAVSLCLTLVACSSDKDATPAPAAGEAPTDPAMTSTASPDDGAATGQPGQVKDVTWLVGDPPASWESLEVSQGERQWQVREECLFTLDQPAGIDPDKVPAEQVLTDTETKLEGALGFELDPGPITTESFPVQSNDSSITTADVVTRDYTSAAGATGSIYAFREGEYALVIYTACSANVPFDEVNAEDFAPFIDEQVSINLTY